MGVHSAAFTVGSSSPNHGHETAGRIISRIARRAQVGEISRLGSLPYRWFWLTINSEQQWLPPGADKTEEDDQLSEGDDHHLLVPLGFPVIKALPPKLTFTSKFIVDAIVLHIVATKPAGDPGRRLVLQMDNASPHRARLAARNQEENRITASPYPVFALELAPSDFFLFGALKGQHSGRVFESPDELIEAIREIASAIPRTILERVFLEWKERLQRYIDINSAYVH
jgi:hypothetical protein